MKQRSFQPLTFVLVTLLGLLLGASVPAFGQLKVTYVDGEALYKADLGSDWTALDEGQIVSPAGYIKTGPKSSVELVGGTKVRLLFSANTLARLHFDGQPTKDRVLIQTGKVLAEVLGVGNSFQVRTPTAAMGVRGTQFTVLASPVSGAMVAVRKGRVFSLGKTSGGDLAGGALVEAGERASVSPGRAPQVAPVKAQDRGYFDFDAFDGMASGKIPTLFDHYKADQDAFFRAYSAQDTADFQLFVLDDQDQQWESALEQNQELAGQLFTAPLSGVRPEAR